LLAALPTAFVARCTTPWFFVEAELLWPPPLLLLCAGPLLRRLRLLLLLLLPADLLLELLRRALVLRERLVLGFDALGFEALAAPLPLLLRDGPDELPPLLPLERFRLVVRVLCAIWCVSFLYWGGCSSSWTTTPHATATSR
jgi:hypothetical protein